MLKKVAKQIYNVVSEIKETEQEIATLCAYAVILNKTPKSVYSIKESNLAGLLILGEDLQIAISRKIDNATKLLKDLNNTLSSF